MEVNQANAHRSGDEEQQVRAPPSAHLQSHPSVAFRWVWLRFPLTWRVSTVGTRGASLYPCGLPVVDTLSPHRKVHRTVILLKSRARGVSLAQAKGWPAQLSSGTFGYICPAFFSSQGPALWPTDTSLSKAGKASFSYDSHAQLSHSLPL